MVRRVASGVGPRSPYFRGRPRCRASGPGAGRERPVLRAAGEQGHPWGQGGPEFGGAVGAIAEHQQPLPGPPEPAQLASAATQQVQPDLPLGLGRDRPAGLALRRSGSGPAGAGSPGCPRRAERGVSQLSSSQRWARWIPRRHGGVRGAWVQPTPGKRRLDRGAGWRRARPAAGRTSAHWRRTWRSRARWRRATSTRGMLKSRYQALQSAWPAPRATRTLVSWWRPERDDQAQRQQREALEDPLLATGAAGGGEQREEDGQEAGRGCRMGGHGGVLRVRADWPTPPAYTRTPPDPAPHRNRQTSGPS